MTTLEALQQLDDGEFHRLCDDLLRRVNPSYCRLRSHGLNEQGQSIVGQPDSYVGDSAASCRIAFCYSVQKKSWWNKVVEEIREAVEACPNVEEVVAAFPWSADRKGPTKGENVNWLRAAGAAAGKAKLTTYHGPEIERLLDTDHQDLRHVHLGIPYSRLSYPAVMASCRQATNVAITDLCDQGRYDPDRYLHRSADSDLFRLWQRALWGGGGGGKSEKSIRLIAVVNDSGFGKTSLLCCFAGCLSPCVPILFLQARYLSFTAEDSLVRAVVQSVQGVLSPELMRTEEAAVVHHLRRVALTVVLDGLEEGGEPAAKQRAIRFWLGSVLGRQSVLIASCRREFWGACSDRTWGHVMPNGEPEGRCSGAPVERAVGIQSDPSEGLRMPGLLSVDELGRAWVAAGRAAADLAAIPCEVREELRHPFTLRAFLDLRFGEPGAVRGRSDILAAWLGARLRAEEDVAARMTVEVYWAALVEVARRIEEGGEGSITVDQLSGVPRFDPSRPPGPAVERLVQAGILESIPGRLDRIRFVVEAVREFFLGESDAARVAENPNAVARTLAKGSFTSAYVRLDRLGRRVVDTPTANTLVDTLADLDPVRAAVVLRAYPGAYDAGVREKVISLLGDGVRSRHAVRSAFAVDLLGQINCRESGSRLLSALPVNGECPFYLRVSGARALALLGRVEAVSFAYDYPWFGSSNLVYYTETDLQWTREAPAEFRVALGDHALRRLEGGVSGDPDHMRAVTVMAHLRDERLVDHLEGRLASNGILQEYENHALFAVGTENAARVFAKSLRRAVSAMSELDVRSQERRRIWWTISPKTADYRYLLTPWFEAELERLIGDADQQVVSLAMDIGETTKSLDLLHCDLLARADRGGLWSLLSGREADIVDPATWMVWWKRADCDQVRRILLKTMSPVPSVEVEEVLIDCLDHPQFRSAAASHLGLMGSQRAATPLRRLLEEGMRGQDARDVVLAIGRLGDPAAITVLAQMAEGATGDDLDVVALSLGLIGTDEAERVLVRLLDSGAEAESLVSGLFLHGSLTGIGRVVREARERDKGPLWLTDRMHGALWPWGWTTGHYYTHICDDELIAYLEENNDAFQGEKMWQLFHALSRMDSENVRRLLRLIGGRSGTPEDRVVRQHDGLRASRLASRELVERGDASVVGYFVAEATRRDERQTWVARDLARLPQVEVAHHVRLALASAGSDDERAVITRLLGFYGTAGDADLVRPLMESKDERLADQAYEALCRLTDPLLIPPDWSVV